MQKGRFRYLIVGAIVISVFTSLHAGLYDFVKESCFASMKFNYPVFVSVMSSLIISILAFFITSIIGLFWWRFEAIRRQRRVNFVRDWCTHEMQSLMQGIKTISRELNIELRYFDDCLNKKKEYNWDRWDRIAEICVLVKRSSGLYNLGENKEVEKYIHYYPELWAVRELLESFILGLDRIHRLISDKEAQNIMQLHRASEMAEDVRERRVEQLNRFMARAY